MPAKKIVIVNKGKKIKESKTQFPFTLHTTTQIPYKIGNPAPENTPKGKIAKGKVPKGRRGRRGGGTNIKSNYQKVVVNNKIPIPQGYSSYTPHTTMYIPYRIGEPKPKKDDDIPSGIPIAEVVDSGGIPIATPVGSSYRGAPTIVIKNKKEDAVSTPIKQVFEGTYSMKKPEPPVITQGDFYTPTIVRKNIEETKVESPIYRLTSPQITKKQKKAVSRINENKEPKKRGRPPKQKKESTII